MNKSELLHWLQEQNQHWEALLDQIGEGRMEQPGVNGDWSMKDIIAHLTGWNQWLATRFQAALRNEPEPSPPWPAQLHEDDDINAWIYQTNHERPLRDLLDETRQVNQQLASLVENLPDDARLEKIDPTFYLVWINDQRFLPGEFFDHFRDDHEPDVRAWLAREQA